MNVIVEQINNVGKAFVDFSIPMLIQASVLIMILLLLELFLRKKIRAVFRYCVWMLVLVKLVIPPSFSLPVGIGNLLGDKLTNISLPESEKVVSDMATIPVPLIKRPQPELYQKLDNRDADVRSLEYKSQTPEIVWGNREIEEKPQPVQSASPAFSITWQGAVFLGWSATILMLLLLLLQRAFFVKGLVAQSEQITGGLNDLIQSYCGQLGIKSKVILKASPNATSPAVCGLFRPVILLPQNLLSKLNREQIKAVLFHELVHIKRGDLWVNLFQTLLQIVYFYNPLLWLANAIIRRVREQAVDEAVQVALGREAESYPQILVDVAKMAFKRPALSLRLIGVVETKSALKTRISRMLSRPIPKKAKLGLVGLLAIIIIGIILLPMAAAKVGPPELVIKGTVTDTSTGKPIAGARVFDDGYGPAPDWGKIKAGERFEWGAITDANGQYSFLTWPEHHSIKVESDGYSSQMKTLYSGHFTLNKKPEEVFDFTLKQNNKTDVQIEVEKPKQTEKTKEVYLPSIDKVPQMLDFLSGELINLVETTSRDDEQRRFVNSDKPGKGDLIYDYSEGKAYLASVEGSVAAASGKFTEFITYKQIATFIQSELPKEFRLKKRARNYQIRVLRADENGCFLEYYLSTDADSAGQGEMVEKKLYFGAVIERIVNDDSEKENMFIDLDKGALITPPDELHKLSEKEQLVWFAERGIDAGCETSEDVRGLFCVDMVAIPVLNDSWDTMSADALFGDVILRQGKAGTMAFMSGKGPLPTTYKFKTREGGIGILQITGFTDKPTGVQIRYKMIQKPAGQVEKANRAVEPVSSREGEDIAIFNSYFPDDLEAGKKLDEWWKNKDSTYLDDDSFFDLFRRGIRRCSIQYKDNFLMQYIGGKYVWHKQPNDPKALDIIYHASFGPGEYKYYAVYSGLSVANPKSEKVLKRLVELALEPHQLDRIIWGVKGFNQADEFIKLLQPYLNSSDLEIRKRAETVIKELEGKAAGQDEEKDIKTETVQKDLQKLIASAKIGETVTIPKGLYTEPVVIDKPLTLKGEDANNCVIEVTADKPAVFVDTKGKGKVTIEGLTIKWQLATSDKNIENPFAVLVKDSKADFNNCTFLPLGNYQRSPAALRASGFTNMTVSNCRFEGYGYTVQFGEGTSGTIQDSIVTNSGHQGISLYEGANVKIVGNIVAGSLYHGIRSTGGRLNARDNLIINNKNRGIYLGNKDASGVITNNIIMGNPEGISGFANSQVTITNNIFADSTYAGVDMRDSCRLNIRDNIFQNNQRAIMLVKETGRDNNMVSKNTFWKNKIIAENLEIKNRLEADPQFADADNGDFSLKAGPAQEQKQGLNEPNVFTRIWEKWKKLDVVKSDF